MRGRGKSCEARPREQGRHAVSMKIALIGSKRGNITEMRKRVTPWRVKGYIEIVSN